MTLDHQNSAIIEQAARFVVETPREQRAGRPLFHVIRDRFGLSAMETALAIREAERLRKEARNEHS